MAETFQPQIPKEINQLIEYLEELGFKFKFNPSYREIIIKGQIDDVFGDGYLFSVAVKQGLFKRILIKRYPGIIEIVVSGMNKEFKSESKEIELYFNLEARYEDGHLHITYFPCYFNQYVAYYPKFDRVESGERE
jgi:subtilase family serine protease